MTGLRGRGFDVIVVGTGFAGFSLALFCGRRNLKTLVLPASGAAIRSAPVPVSDLPNGQIERFAAAMADRPDLMSTRQLVVAETDATWAELRTIAGSGDADLLDSETLRERLPALRGPFAGGLLRERREFRTPGHTLIDLRRDAETLGAAVAETLPLDVIRDAGLWAVATAGGAYRAPTLVDAAGTEAGAMAALLGDGVPVRHVTSVLLTTAPTGPLLPFMVTFPSRGMSLRQTEDGRLHVRRDVEAEPPHRVPPDFLDAAETAHHLRELFPTLAPLAVARFETRSRACPVDGRPVLGPSPARDGLVHLFGLSNPCAEVGAGAMTGEWIATGRWPIDIDDYRIGRFAPQA